MSMLFRGRTFKWIRNKRWTAGVGMDEVTLSAITKYGCVLRSKMNLICLFLWNKFFSSLHPKGQNFWNEVSKHLFPLSPVFSRCRFWLTVLAHRKRGELFFLARGEKSGAGFAWCILPQLCLFKFFFFSFVRNLHCWQNAAESKTAIAIQFSTAQRAVARWHHPALSTFWCHCGWEKRHLNTVWPAIVQSVSHSPHPPPAVPAGYYCPLFQKCSSGGKGSNAGQLSWRLDPKDSATVKQKEGREEREKKKENLGKCVDIPSPCVPLH